MTKTRRSEPLSRERIARVALEITYEQGGFTLPDVAARLGVKAPSLYNHVSGRADIEGLVIAQLHEQLAVRLDPTFPWQVLLRTVARAQRQLFVSFPRYVLELGREPARPDSTVTSLELLVDSLLRAGFAPAEARRVIQAIDLLVIGGAVDATGPEVIYPPAVFVGQGALEQVLGGTDETPEAVFEFALECLLVGFERHLAGEVG